MLTIKTLCFNYIKSMNNFDLNINHRKFVFKSYENIMLIQMHFTYNIQYMPAWI